MIIVIIIIIIWWWSSSSSVSAATSKPARVTSHLSVSTQSVTAAVCIYHFLIHIHHNIITRKILKVTNSYKRKPRPLTVREKWYQIRCRQGIPTTSRVVTVEVTTEVLLFVVWTSCCNAKRQTYKAMIHYQFVYSYDTMYCKQVFSGHQPNCCITRLLNGKIAN